MIQTNFTYYAIVHAQAFISIYAESSVEYTADFEEIMLFKSEEAAKEFKKYWELNENHKIHPVQIKIG